MAFSYKQFLSEVKTRGLANQNRFWIQFPNPPAMGIADARLIQMFCKSVTVPGVAISTSSERLTGEVTEVPYDRSFGPATMMFWTDSKFEVKEYFDSWVNSIQDPNTRVLAYYEDIVTDIKINVLDKQDDIKYEVTLYQAHPKSVGTLSLDNEQPGVMVFDVTFDYKNYKTRMIG